MWAIGPALSKIIVRDLDENANDRRREGKLPQELLNQDSKLHCPIIPVDQSR